MTKEQPIFPVGSNPDFERLYRLQVEELKTYALFLIDLNGVITSWNAGVEAILQYPREDFVGKYVAELFTPEDRAVKMPERELQKAAETGTASDVRWHVRKDGTRVFVDGVMTSVRDEGGRLIGYSKVMRDATAAHEAEQALRESDAFTRNLVEIVPICIKVLDLAGRTQMMNRASREELEIDDAAAYHDRLWIDLWEGEARTEAARVVETARSGKEATLEASRHTAKGTQHWLDATVMPIRDSAGKPFRLLVVTRDITDHRNAESLMKRSMDDLAEFAHVASHDLQAPLRTMRSYAQLLARRYQGKLDADADTFLTFMLDAAENMEQLIRGLLNYAEIAGEEERRRVAVSDAVQKATSGMKSLIEETAADIRVGDLPEVEGNPIQIQQVFQNLIGNALKYRGPAQPRIEIDSARDAAHWIFSVKDNGIGIAPEYHERIFQPLIRLHGTEIAGSGLGLAVCKRLVERNGGRIWLKSSPGVGSTFFFTIPIGED